MIAPLIHPRKGRFRPFRPDEGPWLIWSYKWACWHQRSATGGAAGYTNDITQAGIFEAGTARAYHDAPPHRDNVSVGAAKVIGAMERRLVVMATEIGAAAAKVAEVRAALSHPAPASSVEPSSQIGEA